jgi:hypothetical protein
MSQTGTGIKERRTFKYMAKSALNLVKLHHPGLHFTYETWSNNGKIAGGIVMKPSKPDVPFKRVPDALQADERAVS